MPAILIVEDKDAKFTDLQRVVVGLYDTAEITRAATVIEAENLIERYHFDLLVLDISMDINGTSKGALGGGHANLGGLDVVDTMYYEDTIIPTIVVTGLDYFISSESDEGSEYIGLQEVDAIIEGKLPKKYLGSVRYGVDGWVSKLEAKCRGLGW